MASFVRKVATASGARAVQIVHKQGRQVVGIEHIGSAHTDAELAMLGEIAGNACTKVSRSCSSPRPLAPAAVPGPVVLGWSAPAASCCGTS